MSGRRFMIAMFAVVAQTTVAVTAITRGAEDDLWVVTTLGALTLLALGAMFPRSRRGCESQARRRKKCVRSGHRWVAWSPGGDPWCARWLCKARGVSPIMGLIGSRYPAREGGRQ